MSDTIVTFSTLPNSSVDLSNHVYVNNNNMSPPSPYNDNVESVREGTPMPYIFNYSIEDLNPSEDLFNEQVSFNLKDK